MHTARAVCGLLMASVMLRADNCARHAQRRDTTQAVRRGASACDPSRASRQRARAREIMNVSNASRKLTLYRVQLEVQELHQEQGYNTGYDSRPMPAQAKG